MAEITMDDEFGRAIARTIAAFRVQSVIEIGSWDGTGSTTVMMHSLDAMPERRLTCVEPNPQRFRDLQQLVAGRDWVQTICSRSVSRATMLPQSFPEAWNSPYNRLPYSEEVVRSWWNQQHDGPGYLESLTDERWDAALIDGCEFCGYDDYRLLKDRVRVLMLDDVFRAYKCARAHEELNLQSSWACVWSSAYCRNGASIWVHR